jgi:hypothetical protein
MPYSSNGHDKKPNTHKQINMLHQFNSSILIMLVDFMVLHMTHSYSSLLISHGSKMLLMSMTSFVVVLWGAFDS